MTTQNKLAIVHQVSTRRTPWVKFFSSMCVLASVALGTGLPALAYQIRTVSGPSRLTLPRDGQLHPFTITISGKYTRKDFGKGSIPLKEVGFWEKDGDFNFDDQIDLQPEGAVIPEPSAETKRGASWTIQVTFQVGCTAEGEVFGPSGKTKEGNVGKGYFMIEKEWGYNRVVCVDNSEKITN